MALRSDVCRCLLSVLGYKADLALEQHWASPLYATQALVPESLASGELVSDKATVLVLFC